ncbi:sugar phosphate isomerase/epimerase family protein [Alienimonas sp. DA493]|uniref:sugar phosphate isomerase/epimerase family protein n=1 Tax=Alienimonas sp. DA493 TaxID=3373605 RepID=UPI003754AC40
MLRLALPTFLASAPLRTSLTRVAEAGADGVRLDLRTELRAADLSATAARELRHRLAEHNLKAGPAVFPTRGALHEEDRLEERVSGIVAALNLAADLGCGTLSFRPFRLPAADAPAATLLAEVLNDLARSGSHVGVIPCLTPAGDAARLAEVLDRVTTGPFGVNLDPAAVLLGGGEVADTIRTLHDRIETVTARDAINDGAGGKEVPVGRGEVDWEETLALLDEAGFKGWTTCDRTTGPAPFAEASRAVGYLRSVAAP